MNVYCYLATFAKPEVNVHTVMSLVR